MSICAGCGGESECKYCCGGPSPYQGPVYSQQNPYEHTGYVYPPGIPPYVTDILEALKRIEELLREKK